MNTKKNIKYISLFSFGVLALLAGLIFVSWNISDAYQDYKLKKEIDSWLAEHDDYLSSFDKNKDQTADLSFFQANSDFDGAISLEDFAAVLASDSDDYIIVDAREDVEQDEEGYFENSIHMRLADLKAGGWADLPANKLAYVVCSRSFRGQVITDLLKQKNIPARYLEGGLRAWIAYQGALKRGEDVPEGSDTSWSLLSTDYVHRYSNVLFIDSRKPSDFTNYHIDGSINISAMATPSIAMDDKLSAVPEDRNIVLVCDGQVSCFDSWVTGYELQKRGHNILGYFKDISKY